MSSQTKSFGSQVTLEARGDGSRVLRLSAAEPGGLFVLDDKTLPALEEAAAALAADQAARALVVIGSDKGFIAGADVNLILGVAIAEEAAAMARRGQALFARLAALPYPTAAAIHGPCLGGGLELALSLDWRIASDARATKLGLPEVRLGILPGFGGTQRLPRLVGLPRALDLMLKGSQLDAKRALRQGLVDRVVPETWLLERTIETLLRGKPERRLGARDRFLTFTGLGRRLVRRGAARSLGAGPARFFPAPGRIVEVAIRGLEAGPGGDYAAEALALGELAAGDVCKNLIRIFLDSERARKLWRQLDAKAPPIERALVVGGGVMGAGIAAVCARRGVRTRLVDVSKEALGKAVARLAADLRKDLARRRIEPFEAQAAQDALSVDSELRGFKGCDLVLEAVAEKLELKQQIFATAAARAGDGVVLATNTSSLPLARMAEGLPRPEHLVGLHFFNPPEKMPLVEVIAHESSAPRALARAARLASELGKFPVLVKDSPGFLVNRCLAPYLGQAVAMLEARAPASSIDAAAESFGLPMGPMRLLDEVGWDIAASVCRVLADAFPERLAASDLFAAMKQEGLLGRKAGEGIYRYGGKGRPHASRKAQRLLKSRGRSAEPPPRDEDILDRLLLPLVSEAFLCRHEGLVEQDGDLDLAMVMGIGWPAHTGGPLRWARARGLPSLVARMEELAARYGPALLPSPPLRTAALDGFGGKALATGLAESWMGS